MAIVKNCACCGKEFIRANAKFCQECMPPGLTEIERRKVKRKLERIIAPPLACPRCNKEFKMELDDINRKYCYDCVPRGLTSNEQGNLLRRYAKEWAVKYKGGKCIKCGYDKHQAALEFHHLDPTEKEFNLSNRFTGLTNIDKLKEELDKCVLLCANCHKITHFEEE